MTNIGAQKLRGIALFGGKMAGTLFLMDGKRKTHKTPEALVAKYEGLSVCGGGGGRGHNQLFSFVLLLRTDNFLYFLRALVAQLSIS
jgi:hypothetical protein